MIARPLDVAELPLEGLVALEASAGTGKTYTITKLYLRLLLERDLTVDRILVVTFTVAATQELRHRIRTQLEDAERLLRGEPLAQPDGLLVRLLSRVPDRAVAARRIRNALVGFDQAAVSTIHGFCQRVLGEQAFESGQPFVAELLPDGRGLLCEVFDDAWRAATYDRARHAPLWVDWLRTNLKSPEHLVDTLGRYVGRPDVRVVAPPPPGDTAALEAACCEAWTALRTVADDQLVELARTLPASGLTQVSYKPHQVAAKMAGLRLLRARPLPPVHAKTSVLVDYFASGTLGRKMTGGRRPPPHPLFDCCERLVEPLNRLAAAYADRGAAWQEELLGRAAATLDALKRRRQVQCFDDFLVRLADALSSDAAGAALADGIRARFGAALVDEFQDTDALQYAIVRSVWGRADAPLFLVGDPKQAIYGFRGADVYTYLAARREADQVAHLVANHRSDPLLVDGVNALFRHAPRPFLIQDIPFLDAVPADPARPPGLRIVGEDPGPPLQIWRVTEKGNKGEHVERIAASVASEIARLVTLGARGEALVREKATDSDGGPVTRERPLGGGDVAVLVWKNAEARLVREALLAVGVPSVLQSNDSVFQTPEAEQLRLVLVAVAEPGRDDLVRAALATELLGVSGAELDALAGNEAEWTRRMERFRTLHDVWRQHGAARMLRHLLAEAGVAARLLPHAAGERRLTNVLHCCESLAAAAASGHASPESLIAWMAAQVVRDDVAEGDDALLRLESDEHLVRVVTIHKSKGLQYPVVFCPFLWNGAASPRSGVLRYHDPAHAHATTIDLTPSPDASHVEHAAREERAEKLRLLYVALTRAQHRCVVVWGALPDAGTSPLRWLLHPPDDADLPTAALAASFKNLDAPALDRALDGVAAAAPGAVAVRAMPASTRTRAVLHAPHDGRLAARPFTGHVPVGWRIASFSSLTAHRDAEAPDHDAVAAPPPPPPADVAPGTGIHDFPSGARAGSCIHEVFEQHDFASRDGAALEDLAASRLAAHGLDVVWAPAIAQTVTRVLGTALGPHGRIRLDAVPATKRLAELEFTYPLARLDAATLRALLARHGLAGGAFAESVGRLELNPAQGYMRGFIDLVFEADGRWWLLDWKSNRLGVTRDDYRRPALDAAMARHAYWLQYLVYTVAVHRHLQLRLPGYDYDAHFGGVLYLFVRGIDPDDADGAGVFFDRPPAALIGALDRHLRGDDA